jgi:hypothetical protein
MDDSYRNFNRNMAIRPIQIWILYRVLTRADKGLDPEMLLQGFKESLDLPPLLIIDGRQSY